MSSGANLSFQAARVFTGAAFVNPPGAGVSVGDLFLVRAATPEVWQCVCDNAGVKSWLQLSNTAPPVLPQIPGSIFGFGLLAGAAPGDFSCAGQVLDVDGTTIAKAVVEVVLVGTTGNATAISPLIGVVEQSAALSATATRVLVSCDATGTFQFEGSWSVVGDPGRQSATCGWFAVGTATYTFN